MTLKLYYGSGACSFVPHTLLEAAGEPFETAAVKLHKNEQASPEYLAINPRGQVPALVLDDGQVVTQILAIVTYLHERHPGQGFLPTGALERTRVTETLAWMNSTVHTTFTHIFLPHKFTDQPEAQAAIKAHATRQYRGLLAELDAIVQAAKAAGHAWLGGERFGPLDAYALTLLRWGGFAGIDPASLPALWAHVQAVAQHPPVARAMEREKLQLNVYKPA